MGDRSDATWPAETHMTFTESTGRVRHRAYKRVHTDRPGAAERRAQAAKGYSWCRGCREWLAIDLVRSGVCRPCANAEYRTAYAADGAMIRAQKAARKRRLEVVPPWWREEAIEGMCWYGCGRPADTLDHVWPVARGGRSVPGNLVPACGACNSSKKDTDPGPWIVRGFEAAPWDWHDLAALAIEHGTDEWLEAVA